MRLFVPLFGGGQGGPQPVPITPATMKLIAHGNSYVAGYDATPTPVETCPNNFLNQSLTHVPLLGTGVSWLNTGVGSMTISPWGSTNNMQQTGAVSVDANLDPSKLNVVLMWEGINEIASNGQDGVAAYAQYQIYYAARKAFAHSNTVRTHFVLLTSIPCWYGSTTQPGDQLTINAHNAAHVVLNDLIRTQGIGQVCDSYMDIAGDPVFSFGGPHFTDYLQSKFNTYPYYSNIDLIHPVNLGHALIGTIVAADFAQCQFPGA